MAWRPIDCLIAGELNNTVPGKVTGWMRFLGITEKIKFDLDGDFHRDIRGASIRFTGPAYGATDDVDLASEVAKYMEGFALVQIGKVGDITAGLPPQDYCDHPYIEWYGDDNGRCLIELDSKDIQVIGTPIPAIESDPISRQEQHENMGKFLTGILADAQNSPDMHDQVSEN